MSGVDSSGSAGTCAYTLQIIYMFYKMRGISLLDEQLLASPKDPVLRVRLLRTKLVVIIIIIIINIIIYLMFIGPCIIVMVEE